MRWSYNLCGVFYIFIFAFPLTTLKRYTNKTLTDNTPVKKKNATLSKYYVIRFELRTLRLDNKLYFFYIIT